MRNTESNKNIIQAFEIHKNTKQLGAGEGISTYGYEIIHATEDGSVSFKFYDSSMMDIVCLVGCDLAIGSDVQSITVTSGNILIS